MSKIISLKTTTTTKALIIGTSVTVSVILLYKSYRHFRSRSLSAVVTKCAETQTDGCVESTMSYLKANGRLSPTKLRSPPGPLSGAGDTYVLHRQRTHSFRNNLNRSLDEVLANSYQKFNESEDFFESSSIISNATTTTLGYWECEPNLHFFIFYQKSMEELDSIVSPRVDRTVQMCCENYSEFKAKVHCLRRTFDQIFIDSLENRDYFKSMGKEILELLLDHTLRDPTECITAYYAMIDYMSDTSNHESIKKEISVRSIPCLSFYDLVLDYIILDSFDDVENPPSAVISVANNRWLSAGFRELALQTAVSAVMRRKRSKLTVSDGFFAHFYSILDHVSPVLAWGFLGSDPDLKFKCFLVKESLQSVIRDYFSFDRCRYTSLEDLSEDILRTTRERYWELNNKLTVLNT